MIKYVERTAPRCNFPPNLLDNVKASNAKSEDISQASLHRRCRASKPARPAEPTLSDALSPPVAGKDNTRTGRGTLDSLSGNPLAR